MQSDTQPEDTNKTVSTLVPEAAADPEDPTTVNNSINAPLQQTTAGQQLAGSVLPGSQGSNGSIHRTSRTGWTQHLENNHNKNPSSQRRKISGHPLRVPENLLYSSNTKRKRASPTASNTAVRVENDIGVAGNVNGTNGDLDIAVPSDNVHKYGAKGKANAMADIDAVTLNLSSFSSGSILLSETV